MQYCFYYQQSVGAYKNKAGEIPCVYYFHLKSNQLYIHVS